MNATAQHHPHRGVLLACAARAGNAVADIVAARRHVDDDRCESCAEIVFRMLNSRRGLARACAYSAHWVRPVHVFGAAGRRTALSSDVRVVCAAGPYGLSVLVRDCPDDRMVSFVGQVTRADREREPVTGLPVRLVGLPHPAAEPAVTDEFGEFALSAGRWGTFGLRLGDGADAPCAAVWEAWER